MPDSGASVLGGKPVTVGDLPLVAGELIEKCRPLKVWLFTGDLGAGKTTLIKAIGERLGVKDPMSSPTFSIINEYAAADREVIYHFDFYRLKDEQEAFDIGVDEYLGSDHYCFIEWADRVPSLIPDERVEISILPGEKPEDRIIEYVRHD